MKNAKTVLCLIAVLALTASAAACGKKNEEQGSLTSQSAALMSAQKDDDDDLGNDDEDDARDALQTDTDAETDDASDDKPVDLSKVKVKSTTSASETKSTTTAATTTVSSSGSNASASTTAPKSDSSVSGAGNTSDAAAGNSADTNAVTTTAANHDSGAAAPASGTTVGTAAATEALTDPAPEPDGTVEENVVAGVIDFNTNTFEGEGITLNGATYTISGEGTYLLSGELTGMVEVNSPGKVKLKLDGVTITDPAGPAITCTDARKLTITLIEGTYNCLTDGANDAYDGCICSNDTLEIKGAGTLVVNGTYAHGISSDDDLIIKNGDITVNAVKSGFIANDDITIEEGTLHVTGGTNGIKSKGTLNIFGGTMFVYGGAREDKCSLYAGSTFTLTGGYIYALGCGTAMPDPATSTQCAIGVRYTPSLEANSNAVITCEGMEFLNETSGCAYNTVFLSTPDLYDGMAFSVFANGTEYGAGFTTAGVSTIVEAALS